MTPTYRAYGSVRLLAVVRVGPVRHTTPWNVGEQQAVHANSRTRELARALAQFGGGMSAMPHDHQGGASMLADHHRIGHRQHGWRVDDDHVIGRGERFQDLSKPIANEEFG